MTDSSEGSAGKVIRFEIVTAVDTYKYSLTYAMDAAGLCYIAIGGGYKDPHSLAERAHHELHCKAMSTLLAARVLTADECCLWWAAVQTGPKGYCPQAKAEVKGALDAAAKLLYRRMAQLREAN